MKAYHIYTLMGLVGLLVILQAWNTYTLRQLQDEKTLARTNLPQTKKRKVTYPEYYWRTISKEKLSEKRASEEAINVKKNEGVSFITAVNKVHSLVTMLNGEEYVGTLYETEDSVIIVTKRTITEYITPDNPFY